VPAEEANHDETKNCPAKQYLRQSGGEMTEQKTSESNEGATREIGLEEARGKVFLPNARRSRRLQWTPIPLYVSFDQAKS
jgi:hypothetical protein